MEQKTNKKVLLVAITFAACLIFAAMQGLHDNYGIMTNSLTERTGLSYGSISFIIGVGAFLYGLAQPFMGMLALKKSNVFVMTLGLLMISGGLILTIFSKSFPAMLVSFGLILPIGTTGVGFAILMGAITPMIGQEKAVMVSGIVQASAGVGDALLAPLMERLIANFGIVVTLIVFAMPFILMLPVALWIGSTIAKHGGVNASGVAEKAGDRDEAAANGTSADVPTEKSSAKEQKIFDILRQAFKDHDYRCIVIGFSTCGFNMSIIEAHLFNQYRANGIPGSLSSLTLTVYGVMTMLGALATGYLCTKFKMKNVLGTTYLMRGFISLAFIFLPKSIVFAFIMTGFLGATGDSTVPPTSGIISRKFGPERLAILYGVALVGHQVGAFASASLGGRFVEMGLGYTPLWCVNLVLAVIAATASYCIRE